MPISTDRLAPDADGIARAAGIVRAGGRVAFPTETVYGLGADALSDRAVAGIFAAKDRPAFNPLIVHLADAGAAAELAQMPEAAARLAARFWPGPLTLVLPRREGAGVSRLATAGLASVAVRVPAAEVALALLRAAGPLAAPSANPSGRISPTTPEHVLAGLAGRIEAVLEAGPCTVGVESTVVDLTGPPRLLRPGGLAAEAVEDALGQRLAAPNSAAGPTAPGMLASHYAPAARLRLNARAAEAGEVLLGFGNAPGAAENLSPAGDLTEAAANLFAALHRLDAAGATAIAVAPIPERGLGVALNDRLRRAAAPR